MKFENFTDLNKITGNPVNVEILNEIEKIKLKMKLGLIVSHKEMEKYYKSLDKVIIEKVEKWYH